MSVLQAEEGVAVTTRHIPPRREPLNGFRRLALAFALALVLVLLMRSVGARADDQAGQAAIKTAPVGEVICNDTLCHQITVIPIVELETGVRVARVFVCFWRPAGGFGIAGAVGRAGLACVESTLFSPTPSHF